MTMREPGVRCCHPEVAQRAARFQCDPVLLRPLFSPSQNGRLMHGKRGMAVEVTSGGFRLRGFLGILDETMSFTGISFPPFPTFPGSPSPAFCLGECGECFWRGSALGFLTLPLLRPVSRMAGRRQPGEPRPSFGSLTARIPFCGALPRRALSQESGSIRAESVSHHVASDVRSSELRTQAVEGRAAIVGDGNDVALCHAMAGNCR